MSGLPGGEASSKGMSTAPLLDEEDPKEDEGGIYMLALRLLLLLLLLPRRAFAAPLSPPSPLAPRSMLPLDIWPIRAKLAPEAL